MNNETLFVKRIGEDTKIEYFQVESVLRINGDKVIKGRIAKYEIQSSEISLKDEHSKDLVQIDTFKLVPQTGRIVRINFHKFLVVPAEKYYYKTKPFNP